MAVPSDGLKPDEKESLKRLWEHFCEPASRGNDVSSQHGEVREQARRGFKGDRVG